ncbi:hypothetical protein ACJJTC_002417 [Scirpophaga incertulas]
MSTPEELTRLAIHLYDAGAVKLGDIEAKTGSRTPIYFDLRLVVSHPTLMLAVATHLQCLASKIHHDLLCGVPYAALPFTAVMSVNSNTPMIMKRKEAKMYASKKILEGVYQENAICLIVDDVISSGESLLETVETLRAEKITVKHCIIVLDREQGGAAALKAIGVEVKALFTMTDLIRILRDAHRINDDTVEIISDYIKVNQY